MFSYNGSFDTLQSFQLLLPCVVYSNTWTQVCYYAFYCLITFLYYLPTTNQLSGTNGKGSVSWKVANALTAQGYRTGLFQSPHVSCFRERMRVDGELISEEQVVKTLPMLQRIMASNNIDVSCLHWFFNFTDTDFTQLVNLTVIISRLDNKKRYAST